MSRLLIAPFNLTAKLSIEANEVVFRVDPDAGSGSAEWAVVAVLAVVSLCLALTARREHARTHALEA